MCGIIGLHLKNPDLRPRLGELLTVMLEAMTTRGPDSAGIAIYADHAATPGDPDRAVRYSLRSDETVDWDLLGKRIGAETGSEVRVRQLAPDSAVLVSPAGETLFLATVRQVAPQVAVAGYGQAMVLVKDVGAPAEICARYGIPTWGGYQGVGHTRMATESAVTTEHSHPFAVAADLALVHNGSFSNYASVRRDLADRGVRFDTDNDSEVAARYVAREMDAGADLADALRAVLKAFDGFFTLLVTTERSFAVVRDSFACKPMVVAETPDYIAVASEYVALADLPGVEKAKVFEPMPEEIYTWQA
jgi:methylamine---glutamate N-methyltransferase subunit A